MNVREQKLDVLIYLLIQSRNWRNGYLVPLVTAAREGRLDLNSTDFDSEDEMYKALDVFVNPNKEAKIRKRVESR